AQPPVFFEVRVSQLHASAPLPVRLLALRLCHPRLDPLQCLLPLIPLHRPPALAAGALLRPGARRAVLRPGPVHHHRQRHAPAAPGPSGSPPPDACPGGNDPPPRCRRSGRRPWATSSPPAPSYPPRCPSRPRSPCPLARRP